MPDGSQIGRSASVQAADDAGVLTVANLVTFSRLCAVPFVVWFLLNARAEAAFWTFAFAGATDLIDGFIARRLGKSLFGALLDPISDKVMIVSTAVTLAAMRELPDWLVIILVFRDVLIVGGILALAVLGQRIAIQPLFISKVNTALQIVLVAATLAHHAFGSDIRDFIHGDAAPMLLSGLAWLTAASTAMSGATYVWISARGSRDPAGSTRLRR